MTTAIKAGRLRINLLSIIPFIILYILNPPYVMPVLLFSAAVHECGHIIAVKACGSQIKRFEIHLLGAKIVLGGKLISYKKEALIFAGGGLANLFTAALTFIFIRRYPCEQFFFLFYCNLFFMIFNLLPLSSLDGYGLIKSLVLLKADPDTAEKIMKIISTVCLTCAVCAAVYIAYITKYNISLCIIAARLFMLGASEKK